MKHYLLLLLLLIFTISAPAQEGAEGTVGEIDEHTLDDRINEAVGPITDFIFQFIFYPIPIYKGVTSEVSGTVVGVQELEPDLHRVVIQTGDDLIVEYEVPTSTQATIKQGQVVQEGDPLSSGIAIPFVVLWLIIGAVVFTLYFKFINIRKLKLALDVVRGKYTDPTEKGEVSHFQALTAALSGTVGLGNIAGVAVAISIGGPGATVWMIFAGILGMSSKFVECTLGVKYRNIDENGVVHGGPMFYLSKGFAEKGWGGLGKVLAVFFAICCIGASFGGGNMFQVNQAYQQFNGVTPTGVPGWVFGVFMALLVAVVIIGGIRSIAKVTEKIVPFMCGLYVLAALVVLGVNYTNIPHALYLILAGAFGSNAMYGGLIGVLIVGFQRAAFSNEAGIGSASIAHSAVKTNNPSSEGLVALLEPFIDTVIVCTMTALVIVVTDNYHQAGVEGVTLTSQSFSTVISWFPYLLSIAVILFAFSTMISWSYYGLQAWTYLFGKSKVSDYSYKALFCVFIVIGAAMSLGRVIDFSDAMIFAMCFPNIIGLYVLMPEVRKELNIYLGKIRSGEIIRH